MHLYVIRHAIAVEREAGLPDSERPLSSRGRRRFEGIVRGLGGLRVGFDLVLHSPLLRAEQTARLLEPLNHGEQSSTGLLANAPTGELLALLDREHIALVGHEPWASELIAWLVTGERASASSFALKKGGVAWLEGRPQPGGMLLSGFWRPRTLVAIGR